jgi:HlyD family secretion protein
LGKNSARPVIVAIVLALIACGWWIDRQRNVERATLTGYFEYRPTDISSRVSGRVVGIPVDEGDFAKRGDLLVDLNAAPQTQDYEAKRAQSQAALQQLKEAQAGPRSYDIDRQKAVVAQVKASLAKLLDGATSDERKEAADDVASAQASYNLALAAPAPTQLGAGVGDVRTDILRVRKAQLDQATAAQKLLLDGPRQEDIDAARAQLAGAQAVLAELQAGTRSEDLSAANAQYMAANSAAESSAIVASEQRVRAPFDCIIEHILVARGDLVPAGAPLIRLSDPSDIWLRVYVPESSLAKISIGMPAELAVDGIDGRVGAVVKSIATSGEFTPANMQSPEERGQQVFAVRLRLAKPDPRIKAGMAATVDSIGDWSP